jgi:hypothetical protein
MTEDEAQQIKAALAARYARCGLELHPDKTRIHRLTSWSAL